MQSTSESIRCGFIHDWGFNILEPALNTCITGTIYNSKNFSDGRQILTSKIIDVKLEQNSIGNKYIIVSTTNNSKYILGICNDDFKPYIQAEIKTRKLDKNKYTVDKHNGIVNIIRWYLSTYSM